MEHSFSEDFYLICSQILEKNISIDGWVDLESDDMFQAGSYVGGFDGTEMEFCFSYYDNDNEFWFQLSLDEIEKIWNGKVNVVMLRNAE